MLLSGPALPRTALPASVPFGVNLCHVLHAETLCIEHSDGGSCCEHRLLHTAVLPNAPHLLCCACTSTAKQCICNLAAAAAAHWLYMLQVRQQLLAGVEAGTVSTRAVYISLEHDRMHLETLHYMLLQQRKQDFEAALAAGKVDVHDAACMLPAAEHELSNG